VRLNSVTKIAVRSASFKISDSASARFCPATDNSGSFPPPLAFSAWRTRKMSPSATTELTNRSPIITLNGLATRMNRQYRIISSREQLEPMRDDVKDCPSHSRLLERDSVEPSDLSLNRQLHKGAWLPRSFTLSTFLAERVIDDPRRSLAFITA